MAKTHQGSREGAGLRVGVVVSRFNSAVTERLLTGALEELLRCGVADESIEVVHVPGAFEIPLPVRLLADSGRVDAIVCLGAVVRGETPHFEYISSAVFHEISRLMAEHRIPIALGVLTTDTIEQALERSGGRYGNKGSEAAATALEMTNVGKMIG